MSPHALLERTEHRPWPLPRAPWVMFQSWRDLLFAHWRVPAAALRARVPDSLALEEHDGSAWVGMAPFRLTDLHARGLPPLPGLSDFPELNLRTYVRVGDRPGVYFFSLDAGNRAAVVAARTLYRLPYHHADMAVDSDGREIHFRSVRSGGGATFRARYRPLPGGEPGAPEKGTLEHFLTERYALYTATGDGIVLRAEIHHTPWPLQPVEAEIEVNTVAGAEGVPLPDEAPLVHFVRRQDTLVWLPEALG